MRRLVLPGVVLGALVAGVLVAGGAGSSAAPAAGAGVVVAASAATVARHADALGVAGHLAMENPDDFAHPLVTSTGVVLYLTSAASAPLAGADAARRVELVRATSSRAPVDMLKRMPFSQAEIDALSAVRMEIAPAGVLTYAQTERAKEAATQVTVRPEFADAQAWRVGVDPVTGKISVGVNHASQPLLDALAGLPGSPGVVVEVERDPVRAGISLG